MADEEITHRVEQLQRTLHNLEARTRRNSTSPLFILAIVALIRAVIATLTVPRHDNIGSTALRARNGGSGGVVAGDQGAGPAGGESCPPSRGVESGPGPVARRRGR